jgi:hypothetical protein
MTHRTGTSFGVLLLALLCAASFGAIVRVAVAGDNFHAPTCGIGHGFVSGSSATDGSFFSRMEPGCNSTERYCGVLAFGGEVGYVTTYGTTGTCNAWSRTWGNFDECTSGARVASYPGIISMHDHNSSSAGC